LKVAIQKLNLAILEINTPNSDGIFSEFQQAIQTSAKIVEKLQNDLEFK